MKTVKFFCLFLFILTVHTSYCDIITVPTDYSGIQEAVNAASAGDTVYILKGTYNESVEFKSGITILGQDKDSTVIKGPGSGAAFFRDNSVEVVEVTIENLKFSGWSRAINYYDNYYHEDPTQMGITIKNNIIEDMDEGVFLYWNSGKTRALIENNIFRNCYVGIYMGRADTSVIVKSNFITRCYQGMEINTYSKPLITNNIITHTSYIGIEASGGNSTIVNNTIVFNELGIYLTHNIMTVESNIICFNNVGISDYYSDTVTDYNNIFGNEQYDSRLSSDPHDISVDPLFIDTLNFYLSDSSLCIDAGNPSAQYGNEPDFNGRRINLGAWGNTANATSSNPEIDITVTELNFDSLRIQTVDTLNFKIYNRGTTRLNIDSLYLSVADGYQISGDSTFISSGDSITITLIFNPQRTKDYSTTLHIINNDQDEGIIDIPVTAYGYLEGAFAGTLTAVYSPYYINGDLIIEAETALLIEGGCALLFPSQKILRIDTNAVLTCTGTIDDSVYFLPADNNWGGLYFNHSKDNVLDYIQVENASFYSDPTEFGNAIFALNSSVVARHSSLQHNNANYSGGAIAGRGSLLEFTSCTFSNNQSGAIQSGIMKIIDSTKAYFDSCLFENNNGLGSTLITIVSSEAYFRHCIIKANNSDNTRFIEAYNSILNLTHNTVYDNSFDSGDFINCSNCALNMQNNILWQNTGLSSYINPDQTSTVNYSFNVVDISEGDMSNINTDPQFASLTDFTLKPYSPCIDSGDSTISDPDGTPSDIGARYFHHSNVAGNTSGIWSIVKSPYIIRDDVKVEHEDSLLIEPGVHILFQKGTLWSSGITRARGSGDNKIIFKSLYDTLTNTHGYDLLANDIENYSKGIFEIKNADIYNATLGAHFGYFIIDSVYLANTEKAFDLFLGGAKIDNSTISDISDIAIDCFDGSATITHSVIRNTPNAFELISNSSLTMENCVISGDKRELDYIFAYELSIGFKNGWGFGFDLSEGNFTHDASRADIFFYEDKVGREGENVIQLSDGDPTSAPGTGYTSFVPYGGWFLIKTREGNYAKMAPSSLIYGGSGDNKIEIHFQYLKDQKTEFIERHKLVHNHGIYAQNASINLKNVEINNFSGNGIDLFDVNTTLNNVRIFDNDGDGIFYKESDSFYPTEFITSDNLQNGNALYNNKGFNLSNGSADTINCKYTYWGSTVYDDFLKKINHGNGYINIIPWTDSTFTYLFDDITDLTPAIESTPYSYCLYQNYPNPFNPTTMISYQLSMTSDVVLSIYNLLGQRVAKLVNKKQSAGNYNVEWDASNFPSGVYMYQIKSNQGVKIKKMILLK